MEIHLKSASFSIVCAKLTVFLLCRVPLRAKLWTMVPISLSKALAKGKERKRQKRRESKLQKTALRVS